MSSRHVHTALDCRLTAETAAAKKSVFVCQDNLFSKLAAKEQLLFQLLLFSSKPSCGLIVFGQAVAISGFLSTSATSGPFATSRAVLPSSPCSMTILYVSVFVL